MSAAYDDGLELHLFIINQILINQIIKGIIQPKMKLFAVLNV